MKSVTILGDKAKVFCECGKDPDSCFGCIMAVLIANKQAKISKVVINNSRAIYKFEDLTIFKKYMSLVDPINPSRIKEIEKCTKCKVLMEQVGKEYFKIYVNPKIMFKFLKKYNCKKCVLGVISSKIRKKLEKEFSENFLKGMYVNVIKPLVKFTNKKYKKEKETVLLGKEEYYGIIYTFYMTENGTICKIEWPSQRINEELTRNILDLIKDSGGYSLEETLYDVIKLREIKANEIISLTNVSMPEDEKRALAFELSIRTTKLYKLYPFFVNPNISESYGTINNNVYFDHIKYGRCISNIVLDDETFEKVITLIQIQGNRRINVEEPSVKMELRSPIYHVRIGVDIPPVSLKSINIRNLMAIKQLSLYKLVKLGMMDVTQAAKIIASLVKRRSIIIYGPTGCGKTTLGNAILSLANPSWRVLSIEDVYEVEDQSENGKIFQRFSLTGDRSNILTILLHRNPDLIFFGEILTREHGSAFVFSVNSGIQTIATIHSLSYKSLVSKFKAWGLTIGDEIVTIGIKKTVDGKGRVYRRVSEIRNAYKYVDKYKQLIAKILCGDACLTNRDVAEIFNRWWRSGAL